MNEAKSPLRCLRSDLPEAYSFAVTELPHRVKLDQNEAPVDVPDALKRDLTAELLRRPWNRYVQPAEYTAAKAGLAAAVDMPPEAIAITAGCDRAIDAAFLIGGGPGRRVRWFEPTYPYIGHAARRTFTLCDPVHLGMDIDTALEPALVSAEPAPDIVVFVSPNNPTGGLTPEPVVEAALARRERLVLVDEAYAQFSAHTFAGWTATHDNLLVARSLSKSLLAGVHLGFVAGHPQAIAVIERMLSAPYHLDAMQLLLARRYGEIAPHVQALADQVAAERDRVTRELATLDGITPQPSQGNFVLFAIAGAAERTRRIHQDLASRGVRIRELSGLGITGHLRVTVGTRSDNDVFLDALRQLLDA